MAIKRGPHEGYLSFDDGKLSRITLYMGTVVTDDETGLVEAKGRNDEPILLDLNEQFEAQSFTVGSNNVTGKQWLATTNAILRSIAQAEFERRKPAKVVPLPRIENAPKRTR